MKKDASVVAISRRVQVFLPSLVDSQPEIMAVKPQFTHNNVLLSSAGPSVTGNAQAAPPVAKAKSPEEWVETLVQQMASARDMDDARSRAASILQTFQQAVLHTSGPQASTKLSRTHAVHTI